MALLILGAAFFRRGKVTSIMVIVWLYPIGG
jgi:hypothetical protein